MSDIRDRIRAAAESHKQKLNEQSTAEERERAEAERHKATIDAGKEQYWSDLRTSLLEGGREVKAAFPCYAAR